MQQYSRLRVGFLALDIILEAPFGSCNMLAFPLCLLPYVTHSDDNRKKRSLTTSDGLCRISLAIPKEDTAIASPRIYCKAIWVQRCDFLPSLLALTYAVSGVYMVTGYETLFTGVSRKKKPSQQARYRRNRVGG